MASQDTLSPHSGILAGAQAGITGDPAARVMGQYKKGATGQSILGIPPAPTSSPPKSGGNDVRDSTGGIRSHPKLGGLGAAMGGSIGTPIGFGGPDTGAAGPSTNNSTVDGS